jgi:hypothetical protein
MTLRRLTGEDQLFSKARLLASFTAAAINLIFIVILNKVFLVLGNIWFGFVCGVSTDLSNAMFG